MHPGDPSMQVSHETIYQSLYVYPRGGLKRELQASLRSGRAARRPRGRGPTARGRIIKRSRSASAPRKPRAGSCPATTRATWSIGSTASNSAVATIVERMTGYLTLHARSRTGTPPTPSPTPSPSA